MQCSAASQLCCLRAERSAWALGNRGAHLSPCCLPAAPAYSQALRSALCSLLSALVLPLHASCPVASRPSHFTFATGNLRCVSTVIACFEDLQGDAEINCNMAPTPDNSSLLIFVLNLLLVLRPSCSLVIFIFQVLGMGQEWGGGDMRNPGGGYKINLLKNELEKYKNDSKQIIMFTDA